ncbi:MAG TPA: hypothetical protein VGP65_04420 [Candidatus Angelobacter sp.]|jgi:hypothetical protein|nr:hypothetical protein [Candidatus Angelobacter sp.]
MGLKQISEFMQVLLMEEKAAYVVVGCKFAVKTKAAGLLRARRNVQKQIPFN